MSTKLRLWNLKEALKVPFYYLYERRLQSKARHWRMPQHVGIILDGNRRFARAAGYDTVIAGHNQGADKVNEVVKWLCDMGVPYITIWIFSLDNFSRDSEEVQGLLKLIEDKTRDILRNPYIHSRKVRLNYIGRKAELPEELQNAIVEAESKTADYDQHQLNIAIAYGGREEITDAMRNYLRDAREEGKSIDDILDTLQPDDLTGHFYTSGVPDPDLIIRTSGEVRLSGFLLWQSAYAEYYFCDTFWPSYRRIDLLRALRSYDRRQRRFGR